MAKHDTIKLRRGTAASWASSEPQPDGEVLRLGEPGYEKDTGKLKIGDGVTGWNSLPYFADGASLNIEQIEDDLANSFFVAGSGISLSYDDENDILTISSSGAGGPVTSITTIDLHNGGVQNAEVFQFTDKDYQSVITGPTPDADNNAQRIIIQGQKGQGTGEGGDVYVWGGDADSNGGDIKIYAGDADNAGSGYGGYVNIEGGYGDTQGGNISIEGGNSSSQGGDIYIEGGSPNGIVNIASSNGSYQWVFNATGGLELSTSGLVFSDASTQTTSATNIVNDAFNTSLVAGTGIDLSYDSGTDTLTISTSGTTSGVSDIIAGPYIDVSSESGIYTISGNGEASLVQTSVFNKTGSQIPKFNVVYINGGQGDMPTIALAAASGEMTSSKTYGITAENIDHMSSGLVVVLGALTGLDTDQFNPTAPTGDVNGTTLWLSPTTPGGVTTTKPSAPNHAVAVGTIVRTHQNEGVVEVRIQNGYELEELHNVSISGVSNNQILVYNSGTSLWTNTTLSTLLPTIANSGDNRILTSTGTSTGINAEANITFDGNNLVVTGGGQFKQVYPTVVSGVISSSAVDTDVANGQIFNITLTENITLNNPTNSIDGVTIRWRIQQDGSGGRSVSLGDKFVIPSSATNPLPWSTGANVMDTLAATYHAGRDKWDIVAFVPGY